MPRRDGSAGGMVRSTSTQRLRAATAFPGLASAAYGTWVYPWPSAMPARAPWTSSSAAATTGGAPQRSSSAIVVPQRSSSPIVAPQSSSSPIVATGPPQGSSSAIVAGAASGYHLLRIEGYSRLKSAIPNGKHIESSPFRIAGHTWTIKYYPNGVDSGTADSISLYLVLKDPVARSLTAQFWFSLIDQVDQQTPSFVSSIPLSKFKSRGSWGRNDFIKCEHLELSRQLKDDCFTIRCDIIVGGKIRTEGTTPSVVVPPSDCLEDFRALLLSGQGADVRFLVGRKTFSAHRCLLAARSRVFKAQLFGAMREGTATEDFIRVDGMEPQVFKSLLHFIYTDSPLEMEGQDEGAAVAMAQHMLEAADRYDLQRLKLICEDKLCRYINVSSVATTLVLAEQHQCQGLKEACYEFLKSCRRLNEVMETDAFQHLVESCPSALLELMSKLAAR